LVISATIEDAGVTMPPGVNLPNIDTLSAQVRYEKGILRIAQGTAKVGNSTVHDASGSADLSRGIEGAKYEAKANADTDLGELSPAVLKLLESYKIDQRDQLEAISGRVDLAANAAGVMSQTALAMPAEYRVTADLHGAAAKIKAVPGPVEVRRGSIALAPGSMTFENLMFAVTGGDAAVNGTIDYPGNAVALRGLAVGLHQFPSEVWLGMAVDPNDLAIRGPIGGRVVLNSDPKDPGVILPEGKLTLAQGEIQFNFLRAPIVVQGATFLMNRKALTLSMPGS